VSTKSVVRCSDQNHVNECGSSQRFWLRRMYSLKLMLYQRNSSARRRRSAMFLPTDFLVGRSGRKETMFRWSTLVTMQNLSAKHEGFAFEISICLPYRQWKTKGSVKNQQCLCTPDRGRPLHLSEHVPYSNRARPCTYDRGHDLQNDRDRKVSPTNYSPEEKQCPR
jgi:hypothetical protein